MWTTSLPEDRVSRRGPDNPWHHPASNGPDDDSTNENASTDASRPVTGTWGEHDTGIRDQRAAMEEYETLRRDLSALSHSQSKTSQKSRSRTRIADGGSLFHTISASSSHRAQFEQPPPSSKSELADTTDGDALELKETKETAGDAPLGSSEEDEEFHLEEFMREGHFEKRTDGRSAKRVGVIWKNLGVQGTGSTATFVKTLPDAILGTFGPDLYRILCRFIPSLKLKSHAKTRVLVHDFSGVVRDGEMMLVLGRPGSGCSTFLKAISNKRDDYAAVTGEVTYGGISAEKQKKQFRGEVTYNPEDDKHFAALTVWQTLKFSLMNKTKKREKAGIPIIIDALLSIFGISHVKHTLVGDEFVRGVSGGERKRVSIAETLATKSTVVAWDNSTRGLDSSTALDYAKSLRIMTDVSDRTTFVTLYQAGEQIYELMDKVLLIDSGRCVYSGPAKDAKQYFLDLGYVCPDRQTTPDFLTGITDPNERQFQDGFRDRAPKTPEELENAYKSSNVYRGVLREIEEYERELEQTNFADARAFEQTTREQKSKTTMKKSSYTVSFLRQVYACTLREFWLIFGDRSTLVTKAFIIISTALIVGSLFYGEPLSTEGAFSRGGALFFSILFLGWLQLSELMKAVSGRQVVARHREYAFYRPSAVSIARAVTDLPMVIVQVLVFALIMYFMSGMDVDAGKFFIYALFIFTTTVCITALYRMLAALSPSIDDAVRYSGIALNLLGTCSPHRVPILC